MEVLSRIMYSKEDLVKPFYFQGGKTGILLVHGFTACPVDLKPLGESLFRLGYTVYAPLLAGHGTSPEQMRKTAWKDWLGSAQKGIDCLREKCHKVVAIGHSMGGLIALSLASQGLTDGVVSINAPLVYRDVDLHQADRIFGKQQYVEKPHKDTEIGATKEGLPHYSYVKIPLECLVSLNMALAPVQKGLDNIECPALVIQSLEDSTVNPRSGGMIEKGIKHQCKELIYWPNEDHYLPLSPERDHLTEKIRTFLDKYNLRGNELSCHQK